jgi:putative endopeptidase
MSYSIKNFFKDVNSKWLRQQKIPSSNISISYFDKIEKSIQDKLLKIIHKERKKGGKYGDFMESFYTGRTNDIHMMHLFAESLSDFNDYDGLMKSIGLLNLYDMRCPISLNFALDMKNTESYTVIISEPTTGIQKTDYEKVTDIQEEYKKYLENYGAAIGFPKLSTTFLAIEKQITKLYFDTQKDIDMEVMYNPMTYKNLCAHFESINFGLIFSGCHIPKAVYESKIYTVSNVKYMSEINKYIKTKNLDFWRLWIKSCVYTSLHPYMAQPLRKIYFDFYYKEIQGQKIDTSIDEQALELSKNIVPDVISKLYIESDLEKFRMIKSGATDIILKIKAATHERLSKLSWLSKSSRKIACHKLDKMNFKVAYPDVWYDLFKGISIDKSHFILNLLNLVKQDTLYEIEKLSNHTEKYKRYWDVPCFEVNAFYYGEMNEFCIPIGFLFEPFYSNKMSFIQTVAGLGNIVGHEISHGFDKDGRKFDENGNKYPWWTSLDLDKYHVKTKQIVDLFSNQTYYGLKINGGMTLDENLADFGGLTICLDVVKKSWSAGISESEKKAQLREFFIWYSKTWAYKTTKEHRKMAVKTDVHAPAELRVNTLVPHFEEFYYAFDFKEDEEGYIKPDKRVDVWGR